MTKPMVLTLVFAAFVSGAALGYSVCALMVAREIFKMLRGMGEL